MNRLGLAVALRNNQLAVVRPRGRFLRMSEQDLVYRSGASFTG